MENVRSLVEADRSLLNSIVVPGRVNRNYRPLTAAAVLGQLHILSYLIEEGCSVREDHNYPMFRAALYERCVPAMDLLVRSGADINGVWDDYGPPIIASCERQALGCLKWLLENGAAAVGSGEGATQRVEWNAVVHAAYSHKTHPDLLEHLVEQGGDLDGRDAGQTALHVLARRRDAPGVRLLLDKGASPTITGNNGRLPVAVTRNQRVHDILTRRDRTHHR